MVDTNVLIEKLIEYFGLQDNVVFAYLFGSYAEGKMRAGSDIDVAVYIINEKEDENFKFKLKYKDELENIFKIPVDLILMNSAPPLLNHEIFKNGIILKNDNPSILSQFRVKNFYFYLDQMYIINRYLESTKEKIRNVMKNG
ncbi:nucleotidyltransferase domain-containing protein [Thermoanaerobacteraceae bacterium SP2]|nr:nucleotidyltransferase domain-containing protein [Thermoanaerobacteraceae bacterium SP2]